MPPKGYPAGQDYYNEPMDRSIKTYSLEELNRVTAEAGQPKFRNKQLFEWLHKHHALSYDEMTNLPKAFREFLSQNYPLNSPQIADKQVSIDGTRKYILRLHDGSLVETVGIPSSDGKRLSVCVSSQVGCAMACEFCATGREGFSRNLEPFEISDQVAVVERDFEKPVTSVVVMGQGEPFLNFDNLVIALEELNSPESFNIGARHITVSTCGILNGIDRFASLPYQYTLAISLHSAIQADRDRIMPRVVNQSLDELIEHLKQYVDKTNRRVTFEYLLIKGFNDSDKHLDALIEYSKQLLCHINLLTVNTVEGSPFLPPDKETVEKWLHRLNQSGTETTLRNSRGADIDGACGQLKNHFK